MNCETRRNGDVASGVGAGLSGYLSVVYWRILGVLVRDAGKTGGQGSLQYRDQGRGYGGMKQPLPASSSIAKLRPSLFPTGMLPLSLPTISSKLGDRDITRGNLIAADKFNNRGRSNRDPDSTDRRAIL